MSQKGPLFSNNTTVKLQAFFSTVTGVGASPTSVTGVDDGSLQPHLQADGPGHPAACSWVFRREKRGICWRMLQNDGNIE